MTDSLPYSQSCENNKKPILAVLRRHLPHRKALLEIAGGTGQHAVFFADAFPALHWQSSDLADNVDSLNRRLLAAALPNLPPAIPLDVNQVEWLGTPVDAIFTANSLHIMSSASVERFFQGVGRTLLPDGLLLVYGPFKYQNEFTTDSNARFDLWLKDRNPQSGVRDFEWVNALARAQGLELLEDNALPANNQLLVWHRTM